MTFLYAANLLRAFANTETARIGLTVLVVGLAVMVVRLLQSHARSPCKTDAETSRQRANFVLAKNLMLVIALVIVASIWASKIAGAALSLAAVAGAVLLVSKEFLANLLGSALLAISRPYRVGDFIEVYGVSGRVIDTNLLATTVAETHEGHYIDGSTVMIPHAQLLSQSVRNVTAIGSYTVNFAHVGALASENIIALEAALLEAGNQVCGEWLNEAEEHLRHAASRNLVELPSAKPRVLLNLSNAREAGLILRYCCRTNERVRVQQMILRRYLEIKPPAPVAGVSVTDLA
jgi:small-conductance mechanosensitive channel